MIYYIDTEFNGFGGEILSLALVRESDHESRYIVYNQPDVIEPWVAENVIPIMWSIPSTITGMAYGQDGGVTQEEGAKILYDFLKADATLPHIVSDWPDDIAYFCKALMTGPGTMVGLRGFTTQVARVDAYPTTLPNPVQHNAWHDAMALWWYFKKRNTNHA